MSSALFQKKLEILNMPPRAGEYVDVGQYYRELAERVRQAGFKVEIAPEHISIYCVHSGRGVKITGSEREKFVDDAANLRSYHENNLSLKDAIYGWAWSYARRSLMMEQQTSETAA